MAFKFHVNSVILVWDIKCWPQTVTLRMFIIPILLLIQTAYCWLCFFLARNLPYDENYGVLIQAILISLGVWVGLRMIKAWKRNWYMLPKPLFWIWIVIGSPLTFVLALIYYHELFGGLAT